MHGLPLQCGWYSRDHAHKEKWLFFSQRLSSANSSVANGDNFPPSLLSMLGFCLVHPCCNYCVFIYITAVFGKHFSSCHPPFVTLQICPFFCNDPMGGEDVIQISHLGLNIPHSRIPIPCSMIICVHSHLLQKEASVMSTDREINLWCSSKCFTTQFNTKLRQFMIY